MQDLAAIQADTKTIALVGASNKRERPSFGVMAFLLARGYRVYPVNPGLAGQEIQGQRVYASLEDVPGPIDMVDIFRNTADAGGVIDQAIALQSRLNIRTVWCQLGVVPREAAQRAEAAGITAVLDRCPAIEWR